MEEHNFPEIIFINGVGYQAQPMLPSHDHVLYVCKAIGKQVKVRWDNFYHCYEIEGGARLGSIHPCHIYTESLEGDIYMDADFIEDYSPPSTTKSDIGEFIKAMQPIEDRIKNR